MNGTTPPSVRAFVQQQRRLSGIVLDVMNETYKKDRK